MKILFVMRFAVPIHSYRDIIRALAGHRHDIKILFDRKWFGRTPTDDLDALKREVPLFDYGWAHAREDRWRFVVFPVRQIASWRRYFFVEQSRFFLDRWHALFPVWLKTLMRIPFVPIFFRSPMGGKFLEKLEEKTPPDAAILSQIQKEKPDIVVVPVANMRYGAVDVDYGKGARALKIPLVSIVLSWDSVATKGLVQPMPDRMLVWNRAQEEEAIAHHRIPRERIRFIGAPVFDKWFGHVASLSPREVFCGTHNLNPKHPILLYLGSSGNVATNELWLIKELKHALDAASDERLRNMQLVVRPHPGNAQNYRYFNLPNTIVLPREGALPDKPESFQLFYDSLVHSVASVGIYTSGMIDALIVDRPVIALVRKEFSQTQEEAQYFKSIRASGAIEEAHHWEELYPMLTRLLEGRDKKKEKRADFVRTFIRPRGEHMSASEAVRVELEDLIISFIPENFAYKTDRFYR